MNNFTALQALFRQMYVRRWHICEMRREQSLAEHSYAVWALATDLWHHMFPTNHNSMDFCDMQQYCMVHDLEEILAGDCPSVFKREIDKLAPGVLKRAKEIVLEKMDLGSLRMERRVQGSVIEPVVEIADLTEAILYFRKYGIDDPQLEVARFQVDRMGELILIARKHFPQYEWGLAEAWVAKVTASPSAMQEWHYAPSWAKEGP